MKREFEDDEEMVRLFQNAVTSDLTEELN